MRTDSLVLKTVVNTNALKNTNVLSLMSVMMHEYSVKYNLNKITYPLIGKLFAWDIEAYKKTDMNFTKDIILTMGEATNIKHLRYLPNINLNENCRLFWINKEKKKSTKAFKYGYRAFSKMFLCDSYKPLVIAAANKNFNKTYIEREIVHILQKAVNERLKATVVYKFMTVNNKSHIDNLILYNDVKARNDYVMTYEFEKQNKAKKGKLFCFDSFLEALHVFSIENRWASDYGKTHLKLTVGLGFDIEPLKFNDSVVDFTSFSFDRFWNNIDKIKETVYKQYCVSSYIPLLTIDDPGCCATADLNEKIEKAINDYYTLDSVDKLERYNE